MKRKPAVILFDLWRTLGYSLDREPIHEVQKILGHKVVQSGDQVDVIEDPQFMHSCLTTDINDQRTFLSEIARQYGREISEGSHAAFAEVLQRETSGFTLYDDVLPTLKELRRRKFRLGLVSNLWPFPAPYIFNELGLGEYFEHLIYSFSAGCAKPDREIFHQALKLFAVPPQAVLMVGDNLINDVQAALSVGMKAALIDRSSTIKQITKDTPVLRSLLELCLPMSIKEDGQRLKGKRKIAA
ncbi:MAG: HAD family hydrolase [Candidatus Melainabacteria bacterium]|nr:HAD family hydrolase [Candidatus Melainabacteria bacterium]